MSNLYNEVTASLAPYPMEELARIRAKLIENGQKVFDFGTGDPKIPLWDGINSAAKSSFAEISQYPTARGSLEFRQACEGYLERRFDLDVSRLFVAGTRGSKEAVFHLAQSVVGRDGRRTVAYPNPGYPVYRSSILFAQGNPLPMDLSPQNNYEMRPWELKEDIQSDLAAIWINYPHNPTGACVDRAYWDKIIKWARAKDVLILSDDCYADIYHPDSKPPTCPLQISQDRIVALFSLSKRSGMTGFRSGFMAGDPSFMQQHLRARANMGVGNPRFIEAAATEAWRDDKHVEKRRQIFQERLDYAVPLLEKADLLAVKPQATFYVWCRVPKHFGSDDVGFCLELAKLGIIASPSQWLSEGITGYFRLALVPDVDVMREAFDKLIPFCQESNNDN